MRSPIYGPRAQVLEGVRLFVTISGSEEVEAVGQSSESADARCCLSDSSTPLP